MKTPVSHCVLLLVLMLLALLVVLSCSSCAFCLAARPVYTVRPAYSHLCCLSCEDCAAVDVEDLAGDEAGEGRTEE
jgi:hypothetical protein